MTRLRQHKRVAIVYVLSMVISMATASAEAANHYVRQGATGSGSGADWTNACPGFTGACAVSNLVRGDTYYVAEGSYGSLTLNRATSGTALITIKKATVVDHGTNVGWSDSFGDGQATFGGMIAISDYWVIDGQTRDESNWSNSAAYGFRLTGEVTANAFNYPGTSDNMTFRYVDVGGPPSAAYSSGNPAHGFYFLSPDNPAQAISNWAISRSHIHNVNRIPFQLAGASNITIEYSWIGPNWNKETIRGQGTASNIIIRYNVLKNGCQNGPLKEGCTADIGMWDGPAGSFNGSQIYGNVIWRTVTDAVSDGAIFIGGDGGQTAAGASANNVVVYNNTIVSAANGNQSIRFPGSHTGNIARNNIWYLTSGAASDCSANICDNNSRYTSSPPFVNLANGDFRLTAGLAGIALTAPYAADRCGSTRGSDGVWDRGALEYPGIASCISLPPPPPLPVPATPSNLRVLP